jgi:hypothetical protein
VQSGYRTLVSVKTPYLERDGAKYKISPGMQVSAEINLGDRTKQEYLLSPWPISCARFSRVTVEPGIPGRVNSRQNSVHPYRRC